MRPESRKFLWDACQAADRVARFAARRTLEEYLGDEILRSAVERQLEIVGEALSQLRRVEPDITREIAELPRVVAFRNLLAHGYATVNDRVVWGIVDGDLPKLRATLHALLDQA